MADKGGVSCAVEWATGTGPQALRSVCTCGSTGVCEHVVATLETVRRADEAPLPIDPADAEVDLTWLPASDLEAPRARARSVWPVISVDRRQGAHGRLYLDTPRLRGVIRDAESILAMMESTPPDDWDNADRELIRDEAVQEAFGTRVSQRALARALFRLARHPRDALRRRARREPPSGRTRAVRYRRARLAPACGARRRHVRAGARTRQRRAVHAQGRADRRRAAVVARDGSRRVSARR